MNDAMSPMNQNGQSYYLSELTGAKIMAGGKKVGILADLVIIDGDITAEVSHLYVSRPFGDPALVIPWDRVKDIREEEIFVDIESVEKYVVDSSLQYLLLKDHVLDKKVLDTEGREVEVVYDVKLAVINNRLYVTDVDMSRYGLFRRLGFKWFADLIYNTANKIKRQTVSWRYIQPLPPRIGSFQGDLHLKVLKERLSEIHPVDLADIIEDLEPHQREAVFHQLDTESASDTLEEIDPGVQRAILASLTKERIAQLVNEMTPGQAADVLAVLPTAEMREVLALLDDVNRKKIQDILEKHEEKILNYSTSNFLKYAPDMTVKEAHERYRREASISDVVMYIYVVDKEDRLLGVIDIRELLKASDEAVLKDVMSIVSASLEPSSTLREASAMFRRYGFRAIPIVDNSGKILGVIPYRDMITLRHRFLE